VHPRVVLLWAIVMVVVAIGLYAVAPWLLPARVREGPLVQMAAPDGVTLVWYTTRPVACRAVVTIDGRAQGFDAAAEGNRHLARISGLLPGTSYPYEIRAGGRRLVGDLAFQTNRTASERFTFLVLGDSGMGNREQYVLGGLMARTLPAADFVLHTGDLVYPDGARGRYEARFFAPYRHLLARVNFWPCLGNHDVAKDGRAPAYEEVFALPENGPAGLPADHNYWFDYAAARIAVVDSDVDETTLREQVAPWLREVLAAPEPRWKFVAFHHPPYTGGQYPPDARVQRSLVPVFEETGVDVVFSGDDHSYQRMHPLRGGRIVNAGEGVLYIVTAAGGGRLYEPTPQRPEYVAVLDHQHFSFTQVSIDGDELTLRQIALEGQTLDQWTQRKAPGATESDSPPAEAVSTQPKTETP
jgi:3',5'-cyclic AMP phosphodiesterase CpdA